MISTVSICGVDDSILPEEMVEISAKYPFVEWGVHLCSHTGPRSGYPSDEWLRELQLHTDQLRIRGILHGRWERDMLDGKLSIKAERPDIWDTIHRIQVDIRNGYTNLIEALQLIPDKEIVLYSDGYQEIMGMQLNAFPLFSNTNTNYGEYCGRAINSKDLSLVSGYPKDRFWISVDGFRNNDGITMDLLKVERFLDTAEEFVTMDSWFTALLQTGKVQKRFSIRA